MIALKSSNLLFINFVFINVAVLNHSASTELTQSHKKCPEINRRDTVKVTESLCPSEIIELRRLEDTTDNQDHMHEFG